ncbi:MAG: AMP-binding protein [Rhodoferax sp.]|uniref:AMP-binding protein n=1 Tax=Rhodoferax sp. TaxID=50421 RepID=UPI001B41EB9E|nr:AMP-binding protein [Rhodoferax sp.]MBP9905991.1 AMP-binding protein [Rhodoferax sp.]
MPSSSVSKAFPDLAPSLAAELRRAAVEQPERPFIRMMGGEWTYGQVDAETDRVAAGLHAQGVRRGQHVSLMLPNCIEFAVLWFALAKLGAVAAPVNTSFRGQVLANALNLVESRLIVVHVSLVEALREVAATLANIETTVLVGVDTTANGLSFDSLRAVAPNAETLPQPDIHFSELCLLLYTSGTTGRSKAAMISHRFVLAQAQLTILGLGLRADDVLYCPYPMFHLDAAVMTIAPALLLRGVAAIGEKFSVSRYWQEMRELKATVFDFMGATITMLWKQAPSPQDRNHHARLGWGVPLPAWAAEFESRFGCQLVELYGLTEAGSMIFTPQDEPRRPGSCGKPIGPFDVALLDADGFEVPVGEPGELVIRPLEPDLIMQGYYAMPQETLLAFRNLWFHTGDVLKRDADGFLYFVGRRKDIVRRRGENISAAEVEMVIETHPDVLECAVMGVPSEMTEEEVMACVVLRPNAVLAPAELLDFCASRMARFMLPRYLRWMAQLPKTPTDKVEKFRLQQEFQSAEKWDSEKRPESTPTSIINVKELS